MGKQTHNPVAAVLAWVARRPGYMLLVSDDERLAAEAPERFARAWVGLMVMSLVWGVVLMNLWGVAWTVFRDYEPLILPAMATTALFCLWPFRRSLSALAEVVGGPAPAGQSVAAATLTLVVGMCLMGLKPDWQRWEWWEWPAMRWLINWLRPETKLYRVLLLMPLWGAWAMLIALKFCRSSDRTEPQVAALAAGCRAPAAAGCMAVLLLISVVYFQHLGPGSQAVLLVAPVLAAVFGGIGLCRRCGGVCRKALLGVNVLTQIVFVLAYLAGREIGRG